MYNEKMEVYLKRYGDNQDSVANYVDSEKWKLRAEKFDEIRLSLIDYCFKTLTNNEG